MLAEPASSVLILAQSASRERTLFSSVVTFISIPLIYAAGNPKAAIITPIRAILVGNETRLSRNVLQIEIAIVGL